MFQLSSAIEALTAELCLSNSQVIEIAKKFQHAMADGLAGRPSPFKMLPSYLGRPSGDETGCYLALDFGGTNVRVLLVHLLGQGRYQVLAHQACPLKDPQGSYDYTKSTISAEQLFDFIATLIGQVVDPKQQYILGHTFSFPSRQSDINHAELIHWTKEMNTSGVVDRNITQLLAEALSRRGLKHIQPAAVINDTVGTLLTAAYENSYADIGAICGTGLNTAYLESHSPLTGNPMVVNIESGNFAGLPFNKFDNQLDAASGLPGLGRLEKAAAGRYLGEIIRLIALDLVSTGLLASCQTIAQANNLSGKDAAILAGDTTPDCSDIRRWLETTLAISCSTLQDRATLHTIAARVIDRSAKLTAASYLGIIRHLDASLDKYHHIAIDGSLYEKMPGYARTIETTLRQILNTKVNQVRLGLTKDGSGIGAAIAAAIAVKKDI